jgi:HEAT repeat protein
MMDSKQIKSLGLQFARALQVAIKTAAVFPVEHKSSERPIQQSFDFLDNLTKGSGQFTFGFVDKEVMLNKVLTADPSLRPLEIEFTKRGIAAVTFEPGLASSSYKALIYLFAAPPPALDAAGGFLPYLNQNPLERLHVIAAKKQNKNEQGDTIIETDSESYILARQRGEDRTPRDFLDSIDALLQSGCFDPASRAEALSNFTASSSDGTGYGVPIEIPKLGIVKDGEAVLAPGMHGEGEGAGGGGGGAALSAAAGYGASGTGSFAGGLGAQQGFPMGAPTAAATNGNFAVRARASNTGTDTFLQLVEQSVQRSLSEEKGNPQKSLLSLARLLGNTGVEKILERFPAERRQELALLKPEQLAAEYIEDTALQLAGAKLKAAENSSQLTVEEDVLHVLSRSLQATHMADRLAAKLTRFIHDFAVPPHVQEKIREELQWTTYNSNKKFSRLMELTRCSHLEFRRFMEFAKELLAQRDLDRVAALVNHYFDFLDAADTRIESTDLSRVPEIVQTLSSAYSGFAVKTSERLVRALLREDLSEFIHFQAANGLAVLGQCLVAQEEFQHVITIGTALETSNQRAQEKHKKCCHPALVSLLPASSVDRIIENHLQKRGHSASGKATATLLRFAAPGSIQSVLDRLVSETDARHRLALMRLAGLLGSGSIELALKYLADERWYVVRNMCVVLAELNDPDLVEHMRPALRHADVRVQQAALKTLLKARGTKPALVLAESLASLSPQLVDETLDQLMYLKSPNTISALEQFAVSGRSNLIRAIKTVQVLGTIPDVAALYALGRLFRVEELDLKIRRAALTAIASNHSEIALHLLHELSTTWGPLAEEARKELDKRQMKEG